MAEWTDRARTRALVGAFGGTLRFGLAAKGRELTDRGYSRITGEMGAPQDNSIANAKTLRFPPLSGGAERQIDEVLIFDEDDQLLVRATVEQVIVIPRLRVVFEPGDVSAVLLEG